jgi:hypothetical protein
MSNKSRCAQCNHLRGPRRLGPNAKGSDQPRKAPCQCACHGTQPAPQGEQER